MTVLGIGISYGLATLFAMFSGMPIAFALGGVHGHLHARSLARYRDPERL